MIETVANRHWQCQKGGMFLKDYCPIRVIICHLSCIYIYLFILSRICLRKYFEFVYSNFIHVSDEVGGDVREGECSRETVLSPWEEAESPFSNGPPSFGLPFEHTIHISI